MIGLALLATACSTTTQPVTAELDPMRPTFESAPTNAGNASYVAPSSNEAIDNSQPMNVMLAFMEGSSGLVPTRQPGSSNATPGILQPVKPATAQAGATLPNQVDFDRVVYIVQMGVPGGTRATYLPGINTPNTTAPIANNAALLQVWLEDAQAFRFVPVAAVSTIGRNVPVSQIFFNTSLPSIVGTGKSLLF